MITVTLKKSRGLNGVYQISISYPIARIGKFSAAEHKIEKEIIEFLQTHFKFVITEETYNSTVDDRELNEFIREEIEDGIGVDEKTRHMPGATSYGDFIKETSFVSGLIALDADEIETLKPMLLIYLNGKSITVLEE